MDSVDRVSASAGRTVVKDPACEAPPGPATRLSDTEAVLVRLPEVSALARVVERSDWHVDDVLQQSLRLNDFVVALPASVTSAVGTEDPSRHGMLRRIIDCEHGSHTAQDLLAFVALIHDVGKAQTLQARPDGTTRCPGHEAVSARMAPAICARFDLTPGETDHIIRLVGGHGEPYELYKRIALLSEPQREERLRRFEDDWGDDLLPLLLLAYGDLVTSQLKSRRPEKHTGILAFYQAWLTRLAGKLAEDTSRTSP